MTTVTTLTLKTEKTVSFRRRCRLFYMFSLLCCAAAISCEMDKGEFWVERNTKSASAMYMKSERMRKRRRRWNGSSSFACLCFDYGGHHSSKRKIIGKWEWEASEWPSEEEGVFRWRKSWMWISGRRKLGKSDVKCECWRRGMRKKRWCCWWWWFSIRRWIFVLQKLSLTPFACLATRRRRRRRRCSTQLLRMRIENFLMWPFLPWARRVVGGERNEREWVPMYREYCVSLEWEVVSSFCCSWVNFEFPNEGVFQYGMSRRNEFFKELTCWWWTKNGRIDGWMKEVVCCEGSSGRTVGVKKKRE